MGTDELLESTPKVDNEQASKTEEGVEDGNPCSTTRTIEIKIRHPDAVITLPVQCNTRVGDIKDYLAKHCKVNVNHFFFYHWEGRTCQTQKDQDIIAPKSFTSLHNLRDRDTVVSWLRKFPNG